MNKESCVKSYAGGIKVERKLYAAACWNMAWPVSNDLIIHRELLHTSEKLRHTEASVAATGYIREQSLCRSYHWYIAPNAKKNHQPKRNSVSCITKITAKRCMHGNTFQPDSSCRWAMLSWWIMNRNHASRIMDHAEVSSVEPGPQPLAHGTCTSTISADRFTVPLVALLSARRFQFLNLYSMAAMVSGWMFCPSISMWAQKCTWTALYVHAAVTCLSSPIWGKKSV